MGLRETKCWTCYFFEPKAITQDATIGRCHRYPPKFAHESVMDAGSFPTVDAGDWCGEHRQSSISPDEGVRTQSPDPGDVIRSMPLKNLNLPVRLRGRMLILGVATIGEFCDLIEIDIRGIGERSLADAWHELHKLGLQPKWAAQLPPRLKPPAAEP